VAADRQKPDRVGRPITKKNNTERQQPPLKSKGAALKLDGLTAMPGRLRIGVKEIEMNEANSNKCHWITEVNKFAVL